MRSGLRLRMDLRAECAGLRRLYAWRSGDTSSVYLKVSRPLSLFSDFTEGGFSRRSIVILKFQARRCIIASLAMLIEFVSRLSGSELV